MEQIPPSPPPPHPPAFQPVVPVVENEKESGCWDWPLIGFAVLMIAIIWAASQGGSRIPPPSARQKEDQIKSIALKTGIVWFLADYGQLPFPVGGASAKGDLDTDSGTQPGLVTVLIGKEPPGAKLQNPRGTDYLDIKPAKPGKQPGGPPWLNGLIYSSATSECALVDSWGNFYRVRLDTDGDGFVENPDLNDVAEGRMKVKQRVIVWSPGEDGKEETWTDNPKSWD